MSRNERANKILEIVANRGTFDVVAAAKLMAVSTATIRRDFDELANYQHVTRTHGGISSVGKAFDLPIRYRTAKDSKGKHRIAKVAAAMIHRGDRIGINGGTTTTELGRELSRAQRLFTEDGEIGLTVVTNAVNIAVEMVIRPHIKIVVTGGVARPQSYELNGDFAAALLEGLVLDVSFIGVNGVDAVVGATANHEGEALVNRLLAEAAKKVVVLATREKLGQQAFARIFKPSQITTLLTDEPVEPEMRKAFEDQGVEVIVCE
jgi:DeoR family transcriptional regulator of aga operon